MPELPEVETVKNTLNELVLNKTISNVLVLREKNIENDVSYFVDSLKGATIKSFERIGKFIIFHFDNKKVLISHLRMEGKYFFKSANEKPGKHDLLVLYFTDNTCLMYNDTRRFGTLKVSDENSYKKETPINNVGPDPFMLKDESILKESFKNKTIAIKTALLDQSIMSGLGNIYVDEVLFACKIHPETPAKLINSAQLKNILKESKRILNDAIIAGGSTIKSYHPKEGVSGNFQVKLQVYGKKGKSCPRCGSTLRKIFVNGRGTTYCPKCQKNIALPYILGITGPIGSGKSTVCSYFSKHNYKYLNADEIVHDLYKQKDVQNKLKKLIPNLSIKFGEIDRNSLKHFLIENPNKKIQLEKLVHSLVLEKITKQIKKGKSTDKFIIEVPLLFESKFDDFCDETLIIDLPKNKQISNLNSRNSEITNSLKLNQNFNININKKKATYIIINDGDIAKLYYQIDSIFFCK